MNVLFYMHQFPGNGGIETVTLALANFLARNQVKVSICSYVSGENSDLTRRLDVRVSYFPMPVPNVFDDRHNIEALRNVFRAEVFDFVVFQDSYAPVEHPLYVVLKEYPVRLIVVEHNRPMRRDIRRFDSFFDKAFWALHHIRDDCHFKRVCAGRRARQKKLFTESFRYVLLSRRYRSELCSLIGVDETDSKIVECGNPLRLELTEYSAVEKKNVVLFVGSLNRRKGVDRLLKIWERFAQQKNGWEFWLIGDGPLRSEVLKHPDYGRTIQWFGSRTDVDSFYRQASIFVMASDYEGWPMVLGEAMQFGCIPVVYDTFQALYDMFDNGVNGFIIPPFKREKFCRRLLSLASDDALRARMSSQAVKQARKYTVDSLGGFWLDLIRS